MLTPPIPWYTVRAEILEHTEIGHTQKSQDRIWVIATIEDGAGGWADDYPELIGNPVYLFADGQTSCYDIWDDGACFLSRREAEAWLDAVMPEPYRQKWYVVNYGDGHRFEQAYFNGDIAYDGDGFRPKFRGSDAFYARHTEVYRQIEDNLRRTGKRGPIACGCPGDPCGGCVL